MFDDVAKAVDWPEVDDKTPAYTIVTFIAPVGFEDAYSFKNGERVLYLGEITNMPGHVAIVHKEKVHWGYHSENFHIVPEDEV